MSSVAKIRRLLQVLERLQSGRTHSTAELADLCGISRRTVFRDVKTLQEAGIPVLYDSARQGYWVSAQSLLPPTNLTLAETLSLLVLAQGEPDLDRKIPFQDAARDAALKLQSSLPSHLNSYVVELANSVHVQTEPLAGLSQARVHYERIIDCLTRRKKIRLTYHSLAEREDIQTLVSPYRLLFRRHAWYVIGRSSLHRAVRTFHLGRVLESTATEDAYEIPPRFSLKTYFGKAWSLVREPQARAVVRLRFQPLVAENISEVCWHPTQQIAWNEDGTLDFTVTVDGIHEISWWILSYGDQVQVLEPQPLIDLLLLRAQNMVAQYSPVKPGKKKKSGSR